MRLLHPLTLKIASEHEEIPKTVISHVWSECFKWLGTAKGSGSTKPHPKMFIDNEYALGIYLSLVYYNGTVKGCNLDKEKIKKLPKSIADNFEHELSPLDKGSFNYALAIMSNFFDTNYLFSDAVSLYNKNINIFPYLFPDTKPNENKWRKYVPVESHKEIARQNLKTITNKPIDDKKMKSIINYAKSL